VDDLLSRRRFLIVTGAGVAGFRAPAPARSAVQAVAGFPRQAPSLVQRLVQVSHFDPDAVRELVTDRPALATASWDWGFGDWETGLDAASHVGRREIAEFLMAHGARPTIFTFAMFGNLDAVRAMIAGQPGVQRRTGPHGLSLVHHARAGGDDAAAVLAYLEERGDADPRAVDLPLAAGDRAVYPGRYRLTSDAAVEFAVIERRERLAFQFAEEAARNLLHQGDHAFHPVGAPAVRFLFDIRDETSIGVTIRDGSQSLTATRIA